MTKFDVCEKMIREGSYSGNLHACRRDAGALIGGLLASGQLTQSEASTLTQLAVSFSDSKHAAEREMAEAIAWGRQRPCEVDAKHEHDNPAYGWDDVIKFRATKSIVDKSFVAESVIPAPVGYEAGCNVNDTVNYLSAMFGPDEFVGVVIHAIADGKKLKPGNRGQYDRTCKQLCDELKKYGNVVDVFGDFVDGAGAWVRVNALDGNGCSDANVTAYRHTLIEADSDNVEKQYGLIESLRLPCTAIVHSGGKSIHALVRVDADSMEQYRERVNRIYEICKKEGLKVDEQCRNPSRLSRLPGVMRGETPQHLIALNKGCSTFAEWSNWVEDKTDNLPPIVNMATILELPVLKPAIIDGILRHGHKMLLSGPSKAGKSFAQIQLAYAIASGKKWFGFDCRKGPVLYINAELDQDSRVHRCADVATAMGEPWRHQNLECWDLRGHCVPLAELAPKLIRRCRDRQFSAVIIDPIYKLMTGDESDSGKVNAFCNLFDRIARELNCATIYAHHHSKGAQGQRKSIDRAAGSGIFARDPDALLDMIELQVDAVGRSVLTDNLVWDALRAHARKNGQQWGHDCGAHQSLILDYQTDHPAHAGDAGEVYGAALAAAARASAWRVQTTCREFGEPAQVRCWWIHPTHRLYCQELLEDAHADGEEGPARKYPTKRGEKPTQNADEGNDMGASIRQAVDDCGGCGSATVAQLAEFWQPKKSVDAMRRMIHRHTAYRVERGVIIDPPI